MVVKKLFSFDGRIGRGVLWGISIPSAILGAVAWSVAMGVANPLVMLLALMLALATMVVGTATSVKRWHDRGKSGVWYFISLIPIVGPIWAFIELGFLPGEPGPNKYGLLDSGSPFSDPPLTPDTVRTS